MRRPVRTLSRAGALIVASAALALLAVSADAGPPGRWTQITHAHNGATSNLGLARDRHGTLHVLWAGPKFRGFTAIFDTRISTAGAVGKPKAVVSGWSAVNPPTAVATPDGAIHAIVSGQKIAPNDDPHAGLNHVAGPGSWKVDPRAFGHYEITVASNADVHTAALKSGQLVSVWQSAASMLFQTGVDPSTAPQSMTPPGQSPVIAVDQGSGAAVIAYKGISTSSVYFRRIVPALGPQVVMPRAERINAPSIAARAGGGVYSAYTPDGAKVWLLRFGGQPRPVPVPKGARVLTAGVAAGPEGRLWLFYGNEQTTWVTRLSKGVSGFEPVQALKSPPGTVQYFRLEGEGSAGALDLFPDITVDGKTRDGSYHQQVKPALSVAATKKPVKNAKGEVTGVRVTVLVSDAGDPVAGARVAGLPGGAKTTDATGSVVFTVPAGKKGALALKATKAGYVAAETKLSL